MREGTTRAMPIRQPRQLAGTDLAGHRAGGRGEDARRPDAVRRRPLRLARPARPRYPPPAPGTSTRGPGRSVCRVPGRRMPRGPRRRRASARPTVRRRRDTVATPLRGHRQPPASWWVQPRSRAAYRRRREPRISPERLRHVGGPVTVERGVEAAARKQFIVRPLLHYLAVLQHDDQIGVTDRGEAVRDDERSPAREEQAQCLLDLPLRPDVDG